MDLATLPSRDMDGGDEEDGDDELDWEVEQELYKPPDILQGYKYGFANKLNGVFTRFQGELYDVVDVADPDNTSPVQRREMRVAEENEKFDSQHYVADLMDDAVIQVCRTSAFAGFTKRNMYVF